ncbi:MAG: SDR family oxidoreductase [Firmicutes bacterium]|nr:SDR family oxidoreductase [Bacillota bacterium]
MKREMCKEVNVQFPKQHQNRMPGYEYVMEPIPISEKMEQVKKLDGKVTLLTGGDSGIGRAIAYLFAKHGSDIAICYYDEDKDAIETKRRVEEIGRKCLLLPGDLKEEEHCREVVNETIKQFGKIDILINNHAVQYIKRSIEEISKEQLLETFETNILSYFYLIQAALPHLKKGSSIINTTSITAYRGEPLLIDYSATKGAVLALTRSLSQSLVKDGIRVNAVAPGPIWTPLIPASYSEEEVETFGSGTSETPMNRAGQPVEVAPCYLFLASNDASYMTGQVLHPNGGVITST